MGRQAPPNWLNFFNGGDDRENGKQFYFNRRDVYKYKCRSRSNLI